MKTNIGLDDRVIRAYLGMIIVSFGIVMNSAWAVLGIPVFLSAVVGICPLYTAFGINTLSKQQV